MPLATADALLILPTISARIAFAFLLGAVLYTLSIFFIRQNIKDKDGHPIPPGPLLRYPYLPQYPEVYLDEWAKKHGPIYSLFMGTQLYIVISDPYMARDIFINHGAVFSSRKDYFIKNRAILRGRGITSAQYNDTWRFHRRAASQFLTQKAVDGFANMIDYEAHILIKSLYEDSLQGAIPVKPQFHTVRFALNVMMAMSLGTRTDSMTDPLVARTLKIAIEFNDLTGPLSNMADFVPLLQWFQTNKQKRARRLHDEMISVYGALLLQLQTRLNAKEGVPDCLGKNLLQLHAQGQMDWEDICMLTGVFTLGGVHSTAGLIQWFLALLPSHPEVARRAHAEMDSVLGRDQWPSAEDEERLPYIRAIVKEVQRVHAPFWLATPHYSTEDYVYNGMFIPKDTAMIINCYTLHHNERRYPNPEAFNPDRYLGDRHSNADSTKLSNVWERDHWTFGAGRRGCPGIIVAERELWLAYARLLWSFTAHEIPGEPISLEEYEGASGRTPVPFRMKLIPRHERVHSILQTKDEITL